MERIQIDLIDMRHCPDGDFPVTSKSPEPVTHKWVIQKETVLNWTPSISPTTVSSSNTSDSSGLPSLPSSPSSTEVELLKPSNFIPSPPAGSCSNTDFLHKDLSPASKKRKEPDSPESKHESHQKEGKRQYFDISN